MTILKMVLIEYVYKVHDKLRGDHLVVWCLYDIIQYHVIHQM